jgi:hypothetical protein
VEEEKNKEEDKRGKKGNQCVEENREKEKGISLDYFNVLYFLSLFLCV